MWSGEHYIDDEAVLEIAPGVMVDDELQIDAGAVGESLHGVAEPAATFRMSREELIHRLVGVGRECEPLSGQFGFSFNLARAGTRFILPFE